MTYEGYGGIKRGVNAHITDDVGDFAPTPTWKQIIKGWGG